MHDGWEKVPLSIVLEEVRRPVDVASLEAVKYAGVRWYSGGVYRREEVPALNVKGRTVTELRTGDVVYNRMWATKASFGVAHVDVDRCHVTNDFPIFRPLQGRVSSEFIELVLQTPDFQVQAAEGAKGTTERRRLNQADFLRIPVLIPTVPIQRRIVDLVQAVDTAIESTKDELSGARELSLAFRDAYFSVEDDVETLGSVYDVVAGKQLQSGAIAGIATPYLRAGNIADGVLDLREIKEMLLTPAERSKLALLPGDVLVVEGGNGFGKSAVWANELDAPVAFQNHVLRVRARSDAYTSEYASQWARWAHEQRRFRPTGSGIPNIGLGKARAMTIRSRDNAQVFPPQLNAALAGDAAATETSVILDSLVMLKDKLIRTLMRGVHDIPDTYDQVFESSIA